jgi:hypothetical protein
MKSAASQFGGAYEMKVRLTDAGRIANRFVCETRAFEFFVLERETPAGRHAARSRNE